MNAPQNMNNFLYGKCCENLRNRVLVDVITTEMRKKLLKIISQPNYKKCQIVTEDICAVERTKTSILLNKPIFIGIENFPFYLIIYPTPHTLCKYHMLMEVLRIRNEKPSMNRFTSHNSL